MSAVRHCICVCLCYNLFLCAVCVVEISDQLVPVCLCLPLLGELPVQTGNAFLSVAKQTGDIYVMVSYNNCLRNSAFVRPRAASYQYHMFQLRLPSYKVHSL